METPVIRSLIWILFPLFPLVASAQSSNTTPHEKMVGLLQPGMHIGMLSNDDFTSDVVTINVYTYEDYKVAKAIAALKGDRYPLAIDVAKEFPAVDVELNRYVEKNAIKSDDIDEILLLRLRSIRLGTIYKTTKSSVLVAIEDDMKKIQRVPLSRVSSIYLDANPVRFKDSRTREPN